MKLLGSVFAYLFFGVLLGGGILLAVRGNFWLLGAGVLTYLIAVAKIGCLPSGRSH